MLGVTTGTQTRGWDGRLDGLDETAPRALSASTRSAFSVKKRLDIYVGGVNLAYSARVMEDISPAVISHEAYRTYSLEK